MIHLLGLIFIGSTVFFSSIQAGESQPEPDQPVPGKYAWRMEANFPRFGNEKIDSNIRSWMAELIPSAQNDLTGFGTTGLEEGWFEMGIDYAVVSPSEQVRSVKFTIFYSPFGAAHPSTSVAVRNYHLATGERLRLRDIFANPGLAVQIMANHAQDILMDENSVLEDSTWFNEGFLPKEENYAALGLEADGVRIYFQQYQVLPYAYGMPEALIPLELLAPAGPNPRIWPQSGEETHG